MEDAQWYGSFIALRYQLQPGLHLNTRAEWVKDKIGANAFFAGSPGEVYSLTANLDWQINPYLNIIPEFKYDQYDGNGLPLFANKTENNQLLGMVNIVFKF
ncbi:MAG: outer membrane beta-barrel protein [Cycloclasticus sp.]|nr:outer membrane beta-barrel protein [Cycloclasticus sp.]